jgi:hypothetical protein
VPSVSTVRLSLSKSSSWPTRVVVDLVGDLTDRRIERIDRNKADRRIGRAVGNGRDIALADIGGQLHVERCTLIEVADDEIGVHHLDVARNRNVTRLHFSRAGDGQLEPLRTLAFHLERDLLHVEDDVGHVLAHASERGKLVQHVLDLDRGDCGALQGGEQHAAQRVTQSQTEAALQRLRHESRLTAAIAGGLDLQAVGLLQFLPVLGVDSHVFPLGMWREFWSSSEGNPGRCKSEGDASAAPNGIKIRRGGAWKAARRCAGSASHRGSM